MAVVATLNILTKVSTGGLTAGFKQAGNSVQAFGSKMLGLNNLVKGAIAYFGSKALVNWIKGSMEELAKTERGAYNAVAAVKQIGTSFSKIGESIARDVAPYVEALAVGFNDAMIAAGEFNAQSQAGQNSASAWGEILTTLATVGQALWLPFQALSVVIWTIAEGITYMLMQVAKLEKLLPENMRPGLSQLAKEINESTANIADTAWDDLKTNWDSLFSGDTLGKKWEAGAAAARNKAAREGPPPMDMKKYEPPASLMRGSKEAYSASLKADRMMKGAADVQVAELKKVNKHLGDVDPILRDIRAGVRDKWGVVIKPAEL